MESFLREDDDESKKWPDVKFYEDFDIIITINTYNEKTHELERYRKASAYEYVDSEGNRKLSVIKMIPEGETELERFSFFMDFDTGRLTYKQLDTDRCWYRDTGYKVNLKKLIRKMADPKGGISFYRGLGHLPYHEGDLHHFVVKIDTKKGKMVEHLFFDSANLRLKFVYLEGYKFVYEVISQNERKFRDRDFKPFMQCKTEEPQQAWDVDESSEMFEELMLVASSIM
jgi:hypothetical protein